MEKHLKDPVSGLLFHGWDESKKQQWCDPVTGRSPEIWSRSMGWYAMAINKGYLPASFKPFLQTAYNGIQKEFITLDEKGLPHIHHSCSGAGLGGTPYRSGTYEYYVNEPQRSDDLKTIGPLISLFLEMGK
jgi:unsaturated rhamnogalacturonyl hydrolase